MESEIKEKACFRCGYLHDLEKHHIKHKKDGGGNEPKNLWWLCRACHDYQHAKDAVEKAIKTENDRLKVLKTRLALIEKINTPEMILKRGYQPYFDLFPKYLPRQTICGKK